MKYINRIIAIIALSAIAPTAYSGSLNDTIATGDTLTADLLNNAKAAINDNDARITTNANNISNIALTPGPRGPAGADGATGPAGPAGATGPAGADAVFPVGATPGDMLYWDGSVWQLTPAPPVTAWIKTPSLFLCDGVPTWSTSGCTVYSIGAAGPAGGIVFYVINGGRSGLEASQSDQGSTQQWGCPGVSIPDALGTAIGTGRANTKAIVADCGEAGIAALLADEFTLGGFSDWFLPSRGELELMYDNIGPGSTTIGNVGGFNSFLYWSSSEFDGGNAWAQAFNNGTVFTGNKGSSDGVRAVRAF